MRGGRGRGAKPGQRGSRGQRDGNKAELEGKGPVIGFSSTPLSERFASLHKSTANDVPPAKTMTQRVAVNVNAVQKSKRQNVINAKRGIKTPTITPKLSTKKTLTRTTAGIRAKFQGGRSKIGGGRNRNGGGRGGGRGRSEPSVKPEELDMDMDAYWHAGGKGPEPNQAKLDRQMEQYWAEKPTREVLTEST